MGQTKMTFGGRKSQYWVMSQNKMIYGTKQCDFWGQEKLILDHSKTIFGTKKGLFLLLEGDISIHWKVNISTIAR
jgi:hypothetical protein